MSARPSVLTDPEQLKELLGIPFTPEQMACVTAPAAPQVIVAGAGSGKTTVMAAPGGGVGGAAAALRRMDRAAPSAPSTIMIAA
ncbi:UvrD-helicase domain-containing protein, partial [Streptomyces goshikiensis]